ncbi:MAG: hypothetical protein VW683_00345 [Betaproteobacteria bacterium]|jgi:hypothetical protein
MSKRFLTASIDASIYEDFPNNNTGLDEILDIGKISREFTSWYPARSLIKFELPNDLPTSASAFLHLRVANAENFSATEVLQVYALSSSWVEGTQYFEAQFINANDGVTWRRSNTSTSWSYAGGDFVSQSSEIGGAAVPIGTANINQQPLSDFRIDVTDIYQSWYSSSIIPNNGFLLKLDDTSEDNVNNKAILKIFSRNTHTIYEPLLEIAWTDQTFSTGSLELIPNLDLEVAPIRLPESFKKGEVRKLYFNIRDKYPSKNFDLLQRYRNQYYLPSASSYYQIVDETSGLVISSYDQYSVLDTDSSGSYFSLDTTPLSKFRFYNISVKTEYNGETAIFGPWRVKIT